MGTTLFRCLSVSLCVSLSSPSLRFLFFILDCSLLLNLSLSPQLEVACFHSHTHTHSQMHTQRLTSGYCILKGLSVSISQQPCPRGCALPTLLRHEELWRSVNRFPLSFSCYPAPGFTSACKINLRPSPFPRQPYPLSQNG